MTATFLNYINVKTPTEKIYSRLGYTNGKTVLNQENKDKIELYIQQALQKISLKASISRVPVLKIEDNTVDLVSGISFKSKDLADLIIGSNEVLFMGATAGKDIVEEIAENSKGKDVTLSVVYDAVASEMTDAALDWVTNFFSNSLRRENKGLTSRRFSVGYGDFELSNQKVIHEVLELNKLGVSITDEFLLIPEKTVTAIIGIKQV